MTASKDDKFSRTFSSTNPNVARVQTERSALGTNLICNNLAGWPTDTGVRFSTYTVGTDGKTVSRQTDWAGVVSGNTITSLTREAGASDTGNQINEYVEMLPTAKWADELVTGILVQHKQDGTHTGITTDTLTTSGNVTIGGTLTIAGASSDGGWTPISGSISAVTYNGNRSYTLTTSSDNTANVSPGMRLRTTRTVSAPTQSASLNGSTQYFSKSSPAGMTFTDDFTVSAWVKLSSYPSSDGAIASRYTGGNGWIFAVNSSGQIYMAGFSGGNTRKVQSYQSIPLNKWVHVTAQMDMSAYTATTATCYVMVDGVDVPAVLSQIGTPSALTQGGNLEIGSYQSGVATSLFPGKIAQVAIYSAKVTQANIRATISQGLVGTESSLISAYSLSNSLNDLNANGNNLTAQGSATTTNADSPFGGQADGTISSTLDYGIVQSATSSTLVVQVPEGCTIPTGGGVSAVSYSNVKTPYGFPGDKPKWRLNSLHRTSGTTTANTPNYGTYLSGGFALTLPIGSWSIGWQAGRAVVSTVAVGFNLSNTSLVGVAENAVTLNTSLATFMVSGSGTFTGPISLSTPIQQNTASTYVMYTVGNTTSADLDGTRGIKEIFAENAYL